ncbi:tyrosine-type recombinase/integrase [Ensifer aridi]|uniref:tyrosine-type recombinase/integrase n=1 Tax=Ensifer aridi TaxID=1708715 RepID=UPI001FCE1810|nr:tyrosine-type recombinase/integrase [Ensifer aridi]
MPVDIRDRAVRLLLATTGIRNGELRAIHLQDIDWQTGEVFVRRTKGKVDRVVPLLEETCAALADYILRARPKVDSPDLSFTPPVRPFNSASAVSRIVRERLRHTGIELGRRAGAHLLRHSLATRLVGQRRPINEVADLLGHRGINTTALYVKVAVRSLLGGSDAHAQLKCIGGRRLLFPEASFIAAIFAEFGHGAIPRKKTRHRVGVKPTELRIPPPTGLRLQVAASSSNAVVLSAD